MDSEISCVSSVNSEEIKSLFIFLVYNQQSIISLIKIKNLLSLNCH